jgi:glucosamine-6-phosphate deaminase
VLRQPFQGCGRGRVFVFPGCAARPWALIGDTVGVTKAGDPCVRATRPWPPPLLPRRSGGYAASVRVIIQPDSETASRRAANFVADLVRTKPQCVLGLATGSSPLATYRELIRLHREEELDFTHVTTFNLDEYVGLSATHPQSYRQFMQVNLFNHINIDLANTHVPDGRALDFESHCRQYEHQINDAGGIDLQILGIGSDGHIAFNEPGSSLGSRTRLKTLNSQTIRDNARFFGGDEKVPRLAVTMGVGTILESQRCILLAFGEHKAAAIRDTIEGPVTAQVTASALQLHREVICILDEAAASLLARLDYYEEVERAQTLLEAGQFKQLGIGNL